MPEDLSEIKVDVGVLKTQVLTLSALCNKMDQVIEKLVDQHDRHINGVYSQMDKRRIETEEDISEIHLRIDAVLDKMESSNEKIMGEIKSLRVEMTEHNRKEKESLDKLLQWKWTVAGGILVLAWLISHANIDILLKALGK